MKTNAKLTVLSIALLFLLSLSPLFAQVASGGGGGGGGTTAVSPPTVTPPVVQPVDGSFAPTLPINSQEVLLSNNKRLVTTVATWLDSRGFLHGAPGTITYADRAYVPSMANQPDLGEMVALVASLGNFTFETRNPKDSISMSAAFRTKHGRAVFEGSQSFKLVLNSDGSYSTPSPSIKVTMWPNGEQLLEVPGADWVEASFMNNEGETVNTEQLRRDEQTGKFIFPLYWAGQKNIQLTAYQNRDDGVSLRAIYSAETGSRQPTITRSVVPFVAGLANTVIVPADQNSVTINMADEQSARSLRNGVSPLVQITFTKALSLFFYAELPSEVARGFWIRQGNQANWKYYPIFKGQHTSFPLDAGVFDLIIDWPTFGRREDSFGHDGHGKGV
ncbi:MAG: hypothetical protein Q7R93_05165 [bacterium]|nr:hypothetical protein [bacterium]